MATQPLGGWRRDAHGVFEERAQIGNNAVSTERRHGEQPTSPAAAEAIKSRDTDCGGAGHPNSNTSDFTVTLKKINK